jgi:hypothetical protein
MRCRPVAPVLVALLGAALSAPAAAGAGDVSPSALARSTDLRTNADAWQVVARELGTLIANKPFAPAETSGLLGFDVAAFGTVGFVDAGTVSTEARSPWARLNADAEANPTQFLPGVAVRKGLPLSLEVGANAAWLGRSDQTVLGGYGRFAPVEGYREWPDIAVQVGYSAYLGNDELDLGTLDASGSLGYTFPFGRRAGINEGAFSLWGGAGLLRINAQPRLDARTLDTLGIGPVSGLSGKPGFQEGFSPATLHLGFRVRSGGFYTQGLVSTAPRSITTLNMGVGASF